MYFVYDQRKTERALVPDDIAHYVVKVGGANYQDINDPKRGKIKIVHMNRNMRVDMGNGQIYLWVGDTLVPTDEKPRSYIEKIKRSISRFLNQ